MILTRDQSMVTARTMKACAPTEKFILDLGNGVMVEIPAKVGHDICEMVDQLDPMRKAVCEKMSFIELASVYLQAIMLGMAFSALKKSQPEAAPKKATQWH